MGKIRKRNRKIEKEEKHKKRQKLVEQHENGKKIVCNNYSDNIERQCVGKIALDANAWKK
jgi:hypothetical protein